MSKFQDLTNQKFGRLTVLKRAPNKGKNVMWECECSCGNPNHSFVSSTNLKTGKVKSCGCIGKEKTILRNKNPKKNDYIFYKDYVEGKTKEGETFVIDKEDFEKIKNYIWHSHYVNRKNNYVSCIFNGKRIYLHRIIMNCLDNNKVVDHIDGNPLNNRKRNLRICSKAENSRNQAKKDDNMRGIRIRGRSYGATITYKGETKWLGSFPTLEEAQNARDKAELIYFGQYKHTHKEDEIFIVCYEGIYYEVKGETNILKEVEKIKGKDFLIFYKKDKIFNF